jgi:hypothetical protein
VEKQRRWIRITDTMNRARILLEIDVVEDEERKAEAKAVIRGILDPAPIVDGIVLRGFGIFSIEKQKRCY